MINEKNEKRKKNKKTHARRRTRTRTHRRAHARVTRIQDDKQETSGISIIYLRIVLYRIRIRETYRLHTSRETSLKDTSRDRGEFARSRSPLKSTVLRFLLVIDTIFFTRLKLRVMRRFVVF